MDPVFVAYKIMSVIIVTNLIVVKDRTKGVEGQGVYLLVFSSTINMYVTLRYLSFVQTENKAFHGLV